MLLAIDELTVAAAKYSIIAAALYSPWQLGLAYIDGSPQESSFFAFAFVRREVTIFWNSEKNESYPFLPDKIHSEIQKIVQFTPNETV